MQSQRESPECRDREWQSPECRELTYTVELERRSTARDRTSKTDENGTRAVTGPRSPVAAERMSGPMMRATATSPLYGQCEILRNHQPCSLGLSGSPLWSPGHRRACAACLPAGGAMGLAAAPAKRKLRPESRILALSVKTPMSKDMVTHAACLK